MSIRKVELMTKAMNHPIKKMMLNTMANDGPQTVTDLQFKCKTGSHSRASQFISSLERSGLVLSEKSGKHVMKSINFEKVYAIKEGLPHMLD